MKKRAKPGAKGRLEKDDGTRSGTKRLACTNPAPKDTKDSDEEGSLAKTEDGCEPVDKLPNEEDAASVCGEIEGQQATDKKCDAEAVLEKAESAPISASPDEEKDKNGEATEEAEDEEITGGEDCYLLRVVKLPSGEAFMMSIPTGERVRDLEKKILKQRSERGECRILIKGRIRPPLEPLLNFGLRSDDTVYYTLAGEAENTGTRNLGEGAQRQTTSPELGRLQSQMASHMLRSLAQQPALARSLMQSPALAGLREANPGLRRLLEDESLFSEMLRSLADPGALEVTMRSAELALNNLDSVPGGHDHVRRAYRELSEPSPEDNSERSRNYRPQSYSVSAEATPYEHPFPNAWQADANTPTATQPRPPSFSAPNAPPIAQVQQGVSLPAPNTLPASVRPSPPPPLQSLLGRFAAPPSAASATESGASASGNGPAFFSNPFADPNGIAALLEGLSGRVANQALPTSSSGSGPRQEPLAGLDFTGTLQTLQNMGFTNEGANRAVLETLAARGESNDLNKVIDELIRRGY